MSARKYLKSGALLTGGSVVSSVCSFARNIVIARLLSVEDFGIAAIFVITVSLLERMSYIALDRFLVQAADGDDPRVQAVAQAVQAARGVLSAVLLSVLAGPIASLFGVPEVAWAFQVFAIYPLARGFVHLDLARLQREMRFKVVVWSDTLPQLVTLAIAAPLALWLDDYRVVLSIYGVQALSYLAASHIMAERRYQLAWDKDILRRMLGFGWPLLLNGFLLFGITQGDRAIIGTTFTVEELGWYSAAFTLTMMPIVILVRVLRTFFFPLLTRVQDDPVQFRSRSVVVVHACTLCCVLVGVGATLVGPSLLVAMYGPKYSEGIAVIGWLGLTQAVRLAKAGPATVAMAKGETTNPLIANVVRSGGLLLALAAVASGYGVVSVAVCGLIGEVLGLIASVVLLRLRLGLDQKPMFLGMVVAGLVLVPAAWAGRAFFTAERLWTEIVGGSAISFVLTGLLLFAFPSVLGLVRRSAREIVGRGEDGADGQLAFSRSADGQGGGIS